MYTILFFDALRLLLFILALGYCEGTARVEDSAAAGRRLSLVRSLAQETGKSVTKNIISRKL